MSAIVISLAAELFKRNHGIALDQAMTEVEEAAEFLMQVEKRVLAAIDAWDRSPSDTNPESAA